MKKVLFILGLILAFNLSLTSFGAYTGLNSQKGGYIGAKDIKYTLAKDVKNLKDNEYITLKGYIISKVGNEEYTFKDESGTVLIEIDDEDWGGINVGSSDKVILEGEVDREWNSIKVDIKSVILDNK